MKNKIDINKIKERKISEKEIKENEKESNKKSWLLFKVPVVIDIILAIIYILTNKHILLIPISVIFVIILYGWDSKSRICQHCKKWNSTVTMNVNTNVRKNEVVKKRLFRRDKTIDKKEIVTTTKLKCLNCGKIQEKEKIS